MLRDYPVKFDNREIPFTKTWSESYNIVENVGMAEDGSDIIQIKKTDKLSVNVGTRVVDTWMLFFQNYAKSRNLIQVSIYDQELNRYAIRKMRMRNFSKAKVEKSEDLEVTLGLWDVAFDLIETEW